MSKPFEIQPPTRAFEIQPATTAFEIQPPTRAVLLVGRITASTFYLFDNADLLVDGSDALIDQP